MNKLEYDHYVALIRDYIYNNYRMMLRQPDGILRHPFIVPGSAYSDSLWDWDSWITNIAIRQILADREEPNRFFEFEKGCVLNFLEHTGDDGFMPILITPGQINLFGISGFESTMHKPCLAQHIAFIARNGGGCDWVKPYFQKLEKFVAAYFTHNKHNCGLYFWIDDFAIGVDNDPCTYFRPKRSSASIFLNCLMFKELSAMEYIADQLLDAQKAAYYRREKEELGRNIQDKLWDEKDGFYYSADLNLLPVDPHAALHSGAPRHWDYLIQRIGVWSGMLAMWAGIATKEQAERMVKENYLDKRTFCAPYGIRTLSKLEKMYCIEKTSNPSCWLGPIWGISNYFTFKGLADYGYLEEAAELVFKCIELYGKDIEGCGEMHEYYDPETGEGVNNPGFQNWNFLVLNMIAWLEGKPFVSEF